MKKTTQNREIGRPEELELEDLPDRFRDMTRFVEHNWGRIGLGLRRAQTHDDVRATLRLVPDIEQLVPFRGHAQCLIATESVEVDDNELRATRRRYKDSGRQEYGLWSEYHEAHKNAREVTDAMRAAISQFEQALGYFHFFGVLFLTAQELHVKELTEKAMTSEKTVREVQEEKRSLEKQLRCAGIVLFQATDG